MVGNGVCGNLSISHSIWREIQTVVLFSTLSFPCFFFFVFTHRTLRNPLWVSTKTTDIGIPTEVSGQDNAWTRPLVHSYVSHDIQHWHSYLYCFQYPCDAMLSQMSHDFTQVPISGIFSIELRYSRCVVKPYWNPTLQSSSKYQNASKCQFASKYHCDSKYQRTSKENNNSRAERDEQGKSRQSLFIKIDLRRSLCFSVFLGRSLYFSLPHCLNHSPPPPLSLSLSLSLYIYIYIYIYNSISLFLPPSLP